MSPLKRTASAKGIFNAGFTLVELLVATAVLSLLLVMLYGIISQTTSIWVRVRGKVETFQEARAVFSTISQQLSQATLNTYWAYDIPDAPTSYVRQSELHFISDQATNLIPGATKTANPGQAFFFQSPMGYSPTYQGLPTLLNACGFFVQFGDDSLFRPPFVTAPKRYRYRLMQFFQPSESCSVYTTGSNDWFQKPIQTFFSQGPSNPKDYGVRILATNVIFLAALPINSTSELLPPSSGATASSGTTYLSPHYQYDTRTQNRTDIVASRWIHVLPPLVHVIMVAIDENSAVRLEAGNGQNAPLFKEDTLQNAFTEASALNDDLKTLRTTLNSSHLNYRIFTATIPIREAKWSASP